ncbi:MAG: sulfur carrier protein ThiS [Opitutales bacterium]
MQSITITANGTQCEVPARTTLPAFLESRSTPLGRVVVEYNGRALTREQSRVVVLADGDRLEVVRVVAGG